MPSKIKPHIPIATVHWKGRVQHTDGTYEQVELTRVTRKGIEVVLGGRLRVGEKLLAEFQAVDNGNIHTVQVITEVKTQALHHDSYLSYLKFKRIKDADSNLLDNYAKVHGH